jgi:S1-C subfamily serine protease
MRIAVAGLLGGTLLLVSGAWAREWEDSTGTHTIEAELVSAAGGNVWLKTPTGEVVCVPEDRLSLADREYLRSRLAQVAQPLPPAQPGVQYSLVDLTEKVEPAVVRIDAGGAIGSGFVVDPTGIVVTNYHVIEGSRSATATFKDGTTKRVDGYLGVDIAKDIVLLRVPTLRLLPALSLRAEVPRKGESVAAFGAPQGLDFSVSQGIVSAVRTDEEIQKSVSSLTGWAQASQKMLWIQTTAAISGGNSGGPLVDRMGQVVGMNTKTRTNAQNLNFAVSSKDVAQLLSASSQKVVQSLATLPSTKRAASRGGSAPVSSRFPSIELPSGSTFSHTIVAIPKDWPDSHFTKEAAVRLTKYANGEPKALHSFLNARLHGPSFLIAENGSGRWAADYYEGNRHGSFRVWGADSKMALFAQYVRGGKKGFVCVFQNGMPWLIQEWDKNQKNEEYLIGWTGREPTVADTDSLSDPTQSGRVG